MSWRLPNWAPGGAGRRGRIRRARRVLSPSPLSGRWPPTGPARPRGVSTAFPSTFSEGPPRGVRRSAATPAFHPGPSVNDVPGLHGRRGRERRTPTDQASRWRGAGDIRMAIPGPGSAPAARSQGTQSRSSPPREPTRAPMRPPTSAPPPMISIGAPSSGSGSTAISPTPASPPTSTPVENPLPTPAPSPAGTPPEGPGPTRRETPLAFPGRRPRAGPRRSG